MNFAKQNLFKHAVSFARLKYKICRTTVRQILRGEWNGVLIMNFAEIHSST